MLEIRPSQPNELELLKSIYGDTSKNKADVNLPYGIDFSANLLENQNFVSAVFIWTIWFNGQPVGSAYHSYMPRYNVALLALGLAIRMRSETNRSVYSKL